jgi:hypothetical protein
MTAKRPPFAAFHPGQRVIAGKSHAARTRNAGDKPVGCVSIGGDFAVEHHDEIIDAVRRFEKRENATNHDKRILSVRSNGNNLLIDTSDLQLAHEIGKALQATYQGELKLHFSDPDYLLRVHWQR